MSMNWTKADDKRARKMGFALQVELMRVQRQEHQHRVFVHSIIPAPVGKQYTPLNTFASTVEAAEWVAQAACAMQNIDALHERTARTATLLCMTSK